MFEESFTLNDETEILKVCDWLSNTLGYLVSSDADAGSPPAENLRVPSNPQDEKIINYEEAPPPTEQGFTFLSARRWNSYYPAFFPSEGGGYCLISPTGKVILIDVGFGIIQNLQQSSVEVDLNNLCALFITHNHPDHIGDLLRLCTVAYEKGCSFDIYLTKAAFEAYSNLLLDKNYINKIFIIGDIAPTYPVNSGIFIRRELFEDEHQWLPVIDGVKVSIRAVAHGEMGRPFKSPGEAFAPVFKTYINSKPTIISMIGDADGSQAVNYAEQFSDADILVIHIGAFREETNPKGYKHLYANGTKALLKHLYNSCSNPPVAVLLSEFGLEMASGRTLDYYLWPLVFNYHHGKKFVDALLSVGSGDDIPTNILGAIGLANFFADMRSRGAHGENIDSWFAFDRICIAFLARALQRRDELIQTCKTSWQKAHCFLSAASLVAKRFQFYERHSSFPECGYLGRALYVIDKEEIIQYDNWIFGLLKVVPHSHYTNWFAYYRDKAETGQYPTASINALKANRDYIVSIIDDVNTNCPVIFEPLRLILDAINVTIEKQSDDSYEALHETMLSEMPKLGTPILDHIKASFQSIIQSIKDDAPKETFSDDAGTMVSWASLLADKRLVVANLLHEFVKKETGRDVPIIPLDIGTRLLFTKNSVQLSISPRCPNCRKYHKVEGREILRPWRLMDIETLTKKRITDFIDPWPLEFGQVVYAEECSGCKNQKEI